MWRHIKMPGRFDPARWEITLGISARELILVTAAALQAVWFIFVQVELAFALRLTLAFVFALALLGIALVPIKDKPIEQHLWRLLRYKLRPSGRVYRTGVRDEPDLPAAPAPIPNMAAAQDTPAPRVQNRARTRVATASSWIQPDPALVMAAFVCVMVCGSFVAYMGKGGRVDPRSRLTQSQMVLWPSDTAQVR